MTEEKQDELIDEFGEAWVRRFYFLCGSESVSPAALNRRLNYRICAKFFEAGFKNPYIIRKTDVKIRTVQRYRRKFDKRKKKKSHRNFSRQKSKN